MLLFNNDGMSVDSCKNLLDIVGETTPMNIKRMEFYNNMSGDAGAKHISQLLHLLPNMESFRWSSTRTNEEGALALCESLCHCPALRRLEIKDNYFGEDLGEALSRAIQHMPHLEELTLVDLSSDCL